MLLMPPILRITLLFCFKEKKDWEAKGYKPEDMAQDVKVIMPPLDLWSKTK